MITLPKGTAAVLWGGSQWITLRWKDRELELKIPGNLTLRARRRYVLTAPPEFGDFVKTLALRDLKRLISLMKAERGTVVEIVNETLNKP